MLLKTQLEDIRDSIMLDTKSTAGDKHETGRAHLQIAQEQVNRQLADALSQQSKLKLLDTNAQSKIITNGSIIETSAGIYFLSIAAGKLSVDNSIITALSAQSPLGAQLKGRKAGEIATLNGKEIWIENFL